MGAEERTDDATDATELMGTRGVLGLRLLWFDALARRTLHTVQFSVRPAFCTPNPKGKEQGWPLFSLGASVRHGTHSRPLVGRVGVFDSRFLMALSAASKKGGERGLIISYFANE